MPDDSTLNSKSDVEVPKSGCLSFDAALVRVEEPPPPGTALPLGSWQAFSRHRGEEMGMRSGDTGHLCTRIPVAAALVQDPQKQSPDSGTPGRYRKLVRSERVQHLDQQQSITLPIRVLAIKSFKFMNLASGPTKCLKSSPRSLNPATR